MLQRIEWYSIISFLFRKLMKGKSIVTGVEAEQVIGGGRAIELLTVIIDIHT